jgi:hypothetical protein
VEQLSIGKSVKSNKGGVEEVSSTQLLDVGQVVLHFRRGKAPEYKTGVTTMK